MARKGGGFKWLIIAYTHTRQSAISVIFYCYMPQRQQFCLHLYGIMLNSLCYILNSAFI